MGTLDLRTGTREFLIELVGELSTRSELFRHPPSERVRGEHVQACSGTAAAADQAEQEDVHH